MTDTISWFENKDGASLPAVKIIDCVFVMDSSEKIIHLHIEELGTRTVRSEVRYFLNGSPSLEERSRCQVIPPFINAFREIIRNKKSA